MDFPRNISYKADRSKEIISIIANIIFSVLSTNVSIEQKIRFEGFEASGVEVFVKRDDLIHPFISGNKWRKLKYNHQAYRDSGKKKLATFGGAYSNHILATAAFGAMYGIPVIGVIRGEAPASLNAVLVLAGLWGMKFKFVSRTQYAQKAQLERELEEEGYFVIPEGGENEEGVKGCAEIIAELKQPYDHIICATGTGCTFSGLLRGVSEHSPETTCHCIPVVKEGSFVHETVKKYVMGNPRYFVHTGYHFGGYAKTSPELLQFIRELASETGILTDPVYTSKMFFALRDLLNKGVILSGQKVLAVHTGGLTGFLSDKMLTDVQKSVNLLKG